MQALRERLPIESRVRLDIELLWKVFQYSNDAIFVLAPEENAVLEVNPAGVSMFGYSSREELLATPLSAFHPKDLDQFLDFVRSVQEEGSGWTDRFACRAKSGDFISSEISASKIDLGGQNCLLAIVRDVGERRRAEQALRQSEEMKERLIQSSEDCIKMLDLEGNLLWMSQGGMRGLEIEDSSSLIGTSWLDLWAGEDRRNAEKAVADARAGGMGRFSGFRPTMKGREKWWECIVTLIRGEDGGPQGLLAISRDVTEAKQAERHRELLLAELDHRVKNTLATVQSLAMFSLPKSAATNSYVGRVQALAHVHRLLAETRWDGACLSSLAEMITQPYSGRVRISGDRLRLRPPAAQAVAVAVQELLTNATKYGALSTRSGSAMLSWSILGDGGERTVRIEWRELGGPPVEPPTRKGFGTRLIQQGAGYELDGNVDLDYAPDGLCCRIEFPFSKHVARFHPAAAAEAAG